MKQPKGPRPAASFVQIGSHIINLDSVASAHWEGHKLYVHTSGGRFLTLDHQDGSQLWEQLVEQVKKNPSEAA